jgi:hypothetical protein
MLSVKPLSDEEAAGIESKTGINLKLLPGPERIEVYLPKRVAAVLEASAREWETDVETEASLVIMNWAAMVLRLGRLTEWRPVPVDVETADGEETR